MTEKEKMLAGLPYSTRDPELLQMYHRARALFQEYNLLASTENAKRSALLSSLLEEKGEGVWIEAPFYCDYGEHITIGANTFVNANCFFLDNNKIVIGQDGLIGPYVQIYTATHPLKASERIQKRNDGTNSYRTVTKSVHIGDNVWIGGNTVILPGIRIGNNVTIGAGSVVAKDLPDAVLAYGNPCKIVKSLQE